jgi:hypothetical protein
MRPKETAHLAQVHLAALAAIVLKWLPYGARAAAAVAACSWYCPCQASY